MIDCIIIGGGPAGLSAALNIRARGRSVLVVSLWTIASGCPA